MSSGGNWGRFLARRARPSAPTLATPTSRPSLDPGLAEQLRRQNEMMGGIAAIATQLLTQPDHGAAMDAALETAGRLVSVDRVYVFERHDHPWGGDVFSQRYEWCREGVKSHKDDPLLQQVDAPAAGYTALGPALHRGETLTADVSRLGGQARRRLEAQGVVSLMVVPLSIGSQLAGFVGFDDCHGSREWTFSEELLLRTLAADVGAAIARNRSEALIRHQAYHDQLTGLPNRVLYRDRLAQAVAQARNSQDLVGVLTCDIDRFKLVNDTHGHDTGDRLLLDIRDRLAACIGPEDTLARIGGDEFGILLTGLESVEDAVRTCQQILAAFSRPFVVDGGRHYCSLSVGAGLFPYDGADADAILRNADSAAHRAKVQGGAGYQLYSPEMGAAAFERLLIENNLRSALQNGELTVFYQPLIDLRSGGVDGVEALVRWRHPQMGLVLPATFVPLAEDTGLIESVGSVAMRRAFEQVVLWDAEGILGLRVSVNLSPQQFRQPGLVDRVDALLAETGCAPDRVELELTESVVIDAEVIPTLRTFRERGMRLVVDDFGVGYSALSYLRRLPVDGLKIDRTFVADLSDDAAAAVIARSIVDMAHTLGMEVTAEGVETLRQLETLVEWGCDRAQGFLFSSPQPPHEAARVISERAAGIA